MTCCDMHSGLLRHQIRIEKQVRVPDGMGGVTKTWSEDPSGPIYARIQNLTGSERWEAYRTMSANLIRLTVRFKGDANGAPYWRAGEHRVLIRGRYYNIIAIQDKNFDSIWLVLDVMEGEPS